MVRDFSNTNSFTWNPMQEGTYTIQVTVKTSYSATTGESTSVSYTAKSRVFGYHCGDQPDGQPPGRTVQRAPPTSGTSMYVQFSPLGPNPSWTSTAQQPILAGESTNFIVAGMLPNTTYLMRDVVNNGTSLRPCGIHDGDLTVQT